jgi:DNA-binding GntR family transcriptional regulator
MSPYNDTIQGQAPRQSSHATLSAQVHDRLRDDIVSGALLPGQRLTLEAMMERYGVGATPLREALNRLSTSALIHGEDRRGFRVAPATVEHLEDILATRLAIEPILLESAFKAGDLTWEARVLAAFHQLRGAGEMYEASTHTIRSEWEISHRAFHASILSSATLRLLLQFQAVLWDHAARYRNLVSSTGALDPDVLLQEHSQICETVLARDIDLACLLWKRHIEKAGLSVLRSMRTQGLET